jgi:hypothetical protein
MRRGTEMKPKAPAKRGVILVGVAALSGLLVGVATAAPNPEPQGEAPFDLAQISGNGEHLILVIGGTYATHEEAEKAAAALSLGDMAGFYVDSTEAYDVVGVYQQVDPDIVLMKCEEVAKTAGECEPGSIIESHQAITLQYQALTTGAGLALDPDEQRCDSIGHLPCTGQRLSALLADDGQFKKGTFILLSAFRTLSGAQEFAELARDRGASISAVRAVKSGDTYIGLGQEANPDGESGPLLGPLSDPDKYQQ